MRLSYCVLLGLIVLSFPSWAADVEPATGATAMQLVRQALDASLAGNPGDRTSLLHQALTQSPQFAPARWHSGEVLTDRGWLPIQEAQRANAEDRRLREYRQLRDRLDGSVASHTALARWCRKLQWRDHEEFHWRSVLALQPRNKDAIAALDLHEYQGQWLTTEQITRQKDFARRAENALRQWQPLLVELGKAIDGEDAQQRTDGSQRLAALRDPAAIPALAMSLPSASEGYCVAAIAAISNMNDQPATDTLVWQAVTSQHATVRKASIAALKRRPWHAYVPVLVGSLQSPLELSFFAESRNSANITYGYQVVRDDPFAETTYSNIRNALIPKSPRVTFNRYQALLAAHVRNAHASRAIIGQQVDATNRVSEANNHAIYAVLEQTTDQKLSPNPQAWWAWWMAHNELHVEKRHQTRYRHLVEQPAQRPPGTMSCFLAGTRVWAETGLVPIESIRVGDRVLSQDPQTGELALKFVVETTLRPASPTRRVQVGSETIAATRGHPFWSVGQGWRMAKELAPGDRLYTLAGGAAVTLIEDGPDWEAHNLVVDDFGTYFVGTTGLLVRDNTLRQVPIGPVPGYEIVAGSR